MKLLSIISILLFATFALADDASKSQSQKREMKQTQTYTYSVPDSVSTKDAKSKEPKDEERSEKLIEDLRQLYQANFLQ